MMTDRVPKVKGWIKRDLTALQKWNDALVCEINRWKDWKDNKGNVGDVVIVLQESGEDVWDRRIYGMQYSEKGALLKYQLFEFKRYAQDVNEESLGNAYEHFKELAEKVIMNEAWYLGIPW